MVFKLAFLIMVLLSAANSQFFFGDNKSKDKCTDVSISKSKLNLVTKLFETLERLSESDLEEELNNLQKVLSLLEEEHKITEGEKTKSSSNYNFQELYSIMKRSFRSQVTEISDLILGSKGAGDTEDVNDEGLQDAFPKFRKMKTTRDKAPPSLSYDIFAIAESGIRPKDCSDLLVAGYVKSGVYEIYPFKCTCNTPIKVYCDMDTRGGGWTVIMSRKESSNPLNFTRNWRAYKNGFGFAGKDHWIGNEALNLLTSNQLYYLRMELNDGFGREVFGEWTYFNVDTESNRYKLIVHGYESRSSASDWFKSDTSNYFSTFDSDNDKHTTVNCADKHKGGWWYHNCYKQNPTGILGMAGETGTVFNPWSNTDKTSRSAKFIQMKIRPETCDRSVPAVQLNTAKCV